MKGVSVVLVVCGMTSGFAAPADRVGRLGFVLGPQGLASAGIGIGSVATNMGTGLASQTLGAMGGVPMLGPFAQIGQAAVETGNNFAQMGMGIGQLAVGGFGGLGNAAALQLAARQQFGAQLATQQRLEAQLEAQQQLAAQLGAQQQLAAQMVAQQSMAQAAAQQPTTVQQSGGAQQGTRPTEDFRDVLSSPELDSWWKPAPPQPVYIGN